MVSNLKWKMGFGWYSVLLELIFLGLTYYFHGILRWIALSISIIVILYMINKNIEYNGAPWRKVHFRAMMLYSTIAGMEMSKAKNESREFNIINACKELAIKLCGNNNEIFVDAMIEGLWNEGKEYFQHLLLQNRQGLFVHFEQEKFNSLIDATKKLKFGPQAVIANVIENSYGEEEASRYVLALLEGKAY